MQGLTAPCKRAHYTGHDVLRPVSAQPEQCSGTMATRQSCCCASSKAGHKALAPMVCWQSLMLSLEVLHQRAGAHSR